MKYIAPELSINLLEQEIERNVSAALTEDVGEGDLTAQLVPDNVIATATVISREKAILCGTQWFTRCFAKIDADTEIIWKATDGDIIHPGQTLCEIKGKARSLLTSERAGLNFLQMLSGVASKAWRYTEAVAGTGAKIVDTRKTLPGLRLAQKYAVACGGGCNHRIGLYDAILIKENHILAAGSIAAAMSAAKQVAGAVNRCKFIEIEVETLQELEEALAAGAQMILLDNMTLDQMHEAVAITKGCAVLEASGNVSLETVRSIAETGVDRISVGGLTKNVRAVDLSMRLQE
ncbi:carboxylating nicotinate-nucleotide diphosphorylase [Propionivibrio limicola]|uniref:carboxylating nicotinate-nucleotide diphosphorylase n=1 Tax=Propionivibrio limicola TaxID=167645 RepID=UPI001290A7CC|nr:carboxylating nicotinate-nucleotide diphosphorylase [Propionivibrio limicola]